MTYTAVSFCSGGGAFDLAVERAGFQIVAQVEIDEFCCRNLEREWPGLLRLRDMHECGRHNLPYADLFFGGIPCQPFSQAGKRAGDEDERNLWPTFQRIISELRPRVVLLENVPGILAPYRGSDGKRRPAYALTIVGDLARMGYDCEWATLCASDAGAPHKRKRWICLAYTNCYGQSESQARKYSHHEEQHDPAYQPAGAAEFYEVVTGGESLGNTTGAGLPSWIAAGQRQNEAQSRTGLERQSERSSEAVGVPHCLSMAGQRSSGQQVMAARHCTPQSQGSGNGTRHLWPIEPVLGRVLDGLSARLDRSRWPAPQGPLQYSWEPPRVTTTKLKYRKARIEAIGDGVIPQLFYPIALAIHEWLQAQDAVSSEVTP